MRTETASATCQGLLLLGLWILSSGRLEPRDLATGAAAALFVVLINRPLGWRLTRPRLHILPFLLGYVPWLIREIILANLQVAYLVLHPRPALDPLLIEVPTRLRLDTSRTLLANSITLTPGTLTVDIVEGTFIVHALSPGFASLLETGELPNRVARLFGEEPMTGKIREAALPPSEGDKE